MCNSIEALFIEILNSILKIYFNLITIFKKEIQIAQPIFSFSSDFAELWINVHSMMVNLSVSHIRVLKTNIVGLETNFVACKIDHSPHMNELICMFTGMTTLTSMNLQMLLIISRYLSENLLQ